MTCYVVRMSVPDGEVCPIVVRTLKHAEALRHFGEEDGFASRIEQSDTAALPEHIDADWSDLRLRTALLVQGYVTHDCADVD